MLKVLKNHSINISYMYAIAIAVDFNPTFPKIFNLYMNPN